jgi:hypothetical protein
MPGFLKSQERQTHLANESAPIQLAWMERPMTG